MFAIVSSGFSGVELGFKKVWSQIEGLVSKRVLTGLRKFLVKGHKTADDLAAHDDIVQEVCRKLKQKSFKDLRLNNLVGRSSNDREPLSAHEMLEQAELMAILDDFLASRPPQHREAIDLRFFEQLTDRDAGWKIGTAPSTITKRAKAAITQLRTLLGEQGAEFEEGKA